VRLSCRRENPLQTHTTPGLNRGPSYKKGEALKSSPTIRGPRVKPGVVWNIGGSLARSVWVLTAAIFLFPASAFAQAPPEDAGQLRLKLVDFATQEWRRWGRQQHGRVRRKGHRETEPGFAERVRDYWRIGTGRKLGDVSRAGWSSAFIAWVVWKATDNRGPQYRGGHSGNILAAIRNRRAGRLRARFVGYRVNEVRPRVGDLICNSLYRAVSYSDPPNRFPSHCDVIVARTDDEIDVIGGNLSNSVSKRTLELDGGGRVKLVQPRNLDPSAKRWFVLIRVND
jgi:hypothetical protein